jgi:hypothetical protein
LFLVTNAFSQFWHYSLAIGCKRITIPTSGRFAFLCYSWFVYSLVYVYLFLGFFSFHEELSFKKKKKKKKRLGRTTP